MLTGVHGMAGELAHVRVDANGPICPSCGARCLEALSSETALLMRLERIKDPAVRGVLDSELTPSEQVSKLCTEFGKRNGNPHPAVREALREAGWHLGAALAHALSLLDFKWVVLGGPMTEVKAFHEAVDHGIKRLAAPHVHRNLKVSRWRDLWSADHTWETSGAELLGTLAKALDDCGDGYYEGPLRDLSNRLKNDPTATIDWAADSVEAADL